VSAIVIGRILINYGARKGKTEIIEEANESSEEELKGFKKLKNRESAGKLTFNPNVIEGLTLHFAFLGLAILIGFGLQQCVILLEEKTWGLDRYICPQTYPDFSTRNAWGGVVRIGPGQIWRISTSGSEPHYPNPRICFGCVNCQCNCLSAFRCNRQKHWAFPATSYNRHYLECFSFFISCSKNYAWFERAIGNFGQSVGLSPTGVLLTKNADPKDESLALTVVLDIRHCSWNPFLEEVSLQLLLGH
jgi:ESS family glutamate:Na+ symporter